MPRVVIKNETEVPLHIALRHISPIHFINNVAPGQEAVFPHVGRVWFTVEARIARRANVDQNDGEEEKTEAQVAASASSSSNNKKDKKRERREAVEKNNEYTMLQAVAAPVAVSVAALSLGAGAIYVGMAAGAAGGVSAALSTISAQVSTAAASQVPTARRLYKYAQKGQKVVQIGQVLGIGGGALLGNRAAIAQSKQHDEVVRAEQHDELTGQADIERIKKVKEVLMGLIEKSALRSHGWYMKGDRTILIRGGPKAAEVDQWLIIETDTVTPFEVLSEDPNDKPDPEGQEKALKEEQQQ
ncbi:uncharacterized protein FA14DRAFT_186713 [Meira miltonrushii]|uniref:Uncharacterized protein n=1 Tax=Meira miltonrushii TaxID=1280837 RepID=A0A316VG79_9BASI|nr:uncharacterized protein FA14DRAFT_186713 [Meira miltonrushii]PWN36500.1 hypothetical protein FA14DRAFT_186713 [Meira miltonrushii]